jgi:hypothetical protein
MSLASSIGYGQAPAYDLAILHASVLDTRTGSVLTDQTILVVGGIIVGVKPGRGAVSAKKTIDAKGKLVTPGLMDVHSHLTNVLGDYAMAPLNVQPDSIPFYRQRNSQTYLPYGVTTIRIVGEPESWIPMTLDWQYHARSNEPDIYTCGAALVSKEDNRKTYINHVVVDGPDAAEKKIQQYYDEGIRDIKLYWRLRYPEFTAALNKARALHMNVCGHIDRKVTTRDSTVVLGLREFEHLHPYGVEILTADELQAVQAFVNRQYGSGKGSFLGWEMEVWRKLGRNNARMLHSIDLLKQYHASLTPTIHIFGQALGQSFIKGPLNIENGGLNTEDFTPAQRARCLEGYAVMMSYLKIMYDKGIPLNIGTDCPDGGKAVLSEMLLIHQAGIPMRRVFAMATLNNARAIGREKMYGSIDKGKKADLLIFETNPLQNPNGLIGEKTIIKDGKVFLNYK